MKTNSTILALVETIRTYLLVVSGPPLGQLLENISDDLKNLEVSQIQFFLGEEALHMVAIPSELGKISVKAESIEKKTIDQFGLRADDFQCSLEAMKSCQPSPTLGAALENTIENFNWKLLETYLPLVIWDYARLYGELRLLNPDVEEEALFKFFDSSLGECTSHLLSPYLKRDVICRPPCPNIVCTAEEFFMAATDKSTAGRLVSDLKVLFADCLLSEDDREKAWRDFREKVRTEIRSYEDANPRESRQTVSLLCRLLWFITGLIPFVTKEKRMMLFGGYTEARMHIEKFEHLIETRLVPSAT